MFSCFPFVYIDLALAGVQDHFYSDVLRSSNGVMLGAKEFRAPQGSLGLGAVTAQRCFVIMLGADSRFDLRQYFHASPAATLSNGPVWQWAVHIDEFDPGHIGTMPEGKPRLSQLFATQVGHDYVVVANNLEDLQEVVNKLASSGASYGNLTAMHGWETIRRHEVWGYRRYRHTEATDTMAAGMADVAPGTEAFACFLDLRKKTLTAQLIPGPVDGARAAQRLNARNDFPPLMRSEKGIWETSITFSNDEKSDEAAWDVVGLFGFIVYS